ncbi:MAG: PAN domain-containing protein [Alphaproteobacteria bacterium HGW-Alphaproteobacteria-2]|nr:MAG: PAN domain-containing protein [Alphaproteobacteria bacterium HGW-Alphaproteobacteria-2]
MDFGVRMLAGLALACTAHLALAQEAALPERRAILAPDVDFYGGDLGVIHDTTLEHCARACIGQAGCAGFTFNSRNGTCFPKETLGATRPYAGALSARIEALAPTMLARAAERQRALGSLSGEDFAAARALAGRLAGLVTPDPATVAAALVAADSAMARGAAEESADEARAALGSGAGAEGWLRLARAAQAIPEHDWQRAETLRIEARGAALMAYLLAGTDAGAATALAALAGALEAEGRGRAALDALRLAARLAPADGRIAAAAERARRLFGFRVLSHEVESDLAEPRFCASFSEPLRRAGTDYRDFVQLPAPQLAVSAEGNRLCVAGLAHGARYALTLRAGLPAASGEVLAAPVALDIFVRDRAAAARFPGRGYVLPRHEAAALPLVTVNTAEVELALRRVDSRNLLAAMREGLFGRALDDWQEARLSAEIGAEVWRGGVEVAQEINREITTRLPLGEVVAGLPPGLYALSARIPGADPQARAAATQWFVVSDLALASMAGADGLHLFVRSLATAEGAAGARLQLVAADNSILAEAESGPEGYARFAPGLMRGKGGQAPALVTVASGERDFAFLDLTGPEFDLSDRGVAGRPAPGPVDAFLATDRGAYRPGERVNATALARDTRARAITDLALTAVLSRPDGVEYARTVVRDTGAGGHVFGFDLGRDVPRGPWRLALLADPGAPPVATQRVLVEDFMPERIDFDLTLPEGPLDAAALPALEVAARHLWGAPGAGLSVEGELAVSPAEELASAPGFRFGRHDLPPEVQRTALPGGRETDEAGSARLQLAATLPTFPDRPLALTAVVRLAEGSGRPVERRITRPLALSAPVLGLRPLFQGSAPEGGLAEVEVLGLAPGAAPLSGALEWELDRIETRYQWYELHGEWNWEPVTRRSRIAAGRGTLDAGGRARIGAEVAWGRYELAVRAGTAEASIAFDAGWHAPAGVAETPDLLEAALDKPAYAPGETARLRIRPRHAGQLLVTVFTDRLVVMETRAVTEGETEIALPVTDDWATGAHVAATLVRPMDVAAAEAPARALGIAWAGIAPGERLLEATFETLADAAPRAPLDVTLRIAGIAPGETAYATIAAVDLGVLNLTGHAPPDPAAQYFGQRRLGMALRDVYGRLIDGLSGQMGRLRSGGDALPALSATPPPDEAEIVSFFSGPLTADAAGRVTARFDLPGFNGTLRLMAVVWSDSGVGAAMQDVTVRDPVVITSAVPRFLAPGDESRLRLELTHVAGTAGEMALALTASNGLGLGVAPGVVTLAEGGRATLEVPVLARAEGPGRVAVALTTPDGRVLHHEVRLPVAAQDPAVARSLRLTLAPGETLTLDANLLAGLRHGGAQLTLAAGPLAGLDAPGLLAALHAYPWGCTEQLVSGAWPLLYHAPLARALGLPGAGDATVQLAATIRRVLTRQAQGGAFGLWAPGAGDLWLDAYVTDFLSRASAAGQPVPEAAFTAALDNLRNQLAYAGDFERGGEGIAYALHVLAREGRAEIADLRYYAEVKAEAFATPLALAQLGAALAGMGDQPRADALFARAAARLASAPGSEPPRWRVDYGTPRRDAAAVLALADEAGSTAVDRAALATQARGGGEAPSTQEALWSLMAARGGGPSGQVLLDGAALTDAPARAFAAADLAPGRALTNAGVAPLDVALTATGVPEVAPPASGRGLSIARAWFTPEGRPVDPGRVTQGTRLVAVLTVTPLETLEGRLIVIDPLPAGFEIDNPNLLSGGDVAGLAWLGETVEALHAEFRAERFAAAVDLRGDRPFRLAYRLRAVSPGTFHHPAASVEDMYRPAIRAVTATGRASVAQ